jgi:hypothetical protein
MDADSGKLSTPGMKLILEEKGSRDVRITEVVVAAAMGAAYSPFRSINSQRRRIT